MIKKRKVMNALLVRLPEDDEQKIRYIGMKNEVSVSDVLRHLLTTEDTIETLHKITVEENESK